MSESADRYTITRVGDHSWRVDDNGVEEALLGTEEAARHTVRLHQVYGTDRAREILVDMTAEQGDLVDAGDWCRSCGDLLPVNDDQLCQGCFESSESD